MHSASFTTPLRVVFMRASDDLTEPEKVYVSAVCEACPELNEVHASAAESFDSAREYLAPRTRPR